MKKSLLITLDFPPMVGGVAKYLKNLCANLPSDKIIVLAQDHHEAKEFDQKREYKINRKNLLVKIWPHWLPMLWQIRSIAAREKVEILQVGQVLPVGTAVYLLTRLWRRWRYIVYTNGMDVTLPQQYFLKKLLLKKVLKKAFKVVTVSEFTKKELLKLGVKDENIVMVHPGVKVFELFEDTKALEAELLKKYDLVGKHVLLTVSRLVTRKGHEIVIKALAEVVKQFPNIFYVIVGTGPLETHLKELVVKLKLDSQIIFAGEVTEKQKIAWYDLCSVFIMTPVQLSNLDVEGFGIVYLEANGLAKPVIGSRSGGVSDAVQDRLNGLLVEPGNIEQTAQAIIKLFSDPDLSKKIGEQGRQRAMSKFDWPTQVANLKKILE